MIGNGNAIIKSFILTEIEVPGFEERPWMNLSIAPWENCSEEEQIFYSQMWERNMNKSTSHSKLYEDSEIR